MDGQISVLASTSISLEGTNEWRLNKKNIYFGQQKQ